MKTLFQKLAIILSIALITSCSFKKTMYKYYDYSPDGKTENTHLLPLESDSVDFELLEWAIYEETNLQRQRLGFKPFDFEPKLRTSAQQHSQEMIALGYFEHASPKPENRTVKERVRNSGIRSGMSGENIAIHPTMKIQDIIFRPTGGKMAKYAWRNRGVRYTYSELAQDLVQRWLHSPGHRRNILSRHFKYLGVGCARGIFNDLDVFYVTQNFSSTNF